MISNSLAIILVLRDSVDEQMSRHIISMDQDCLLELRTCHNWRNDCLLYDAAAVLLLLQKDSGTHYVGRLLQKCQRVHRTSAKCCHQQNTYDNRKSIRTSISLLSQAHHLQLAADVVFVAVVAAAAAADIAV